MTIEQQLNTTLTSLAHRGESDADLVAPVMRRVRRRQRQRRSASGVVAATLVVAAGGLATRRGANEPTPVDTASPPVAAGTLPTANGPLPPCGRSSLSDPTVVPPPAHLNPLPEPADALVPINVTWTHIGTMMGGTITLAAPNSYETWTIGPKTQFIRDGAPCANPELAPGDWVVMEGTGLGPIDPQIEGDTPQHLEARVVYLN